MDKDYSRRMTREERIRRRKRQIYIRLFLITGSIFVLVFAIVLIIKGAADKSALQASTDPVVEVAAAEEDDTEDDISGSADTEISEDTDGDDTEISDTEEQDAERTVSDDEYAANSAWTVILDAGHGGKDQGCAYGDVLEKDINLSVVLLLSKMLKEAGVNVVLTRDDDTFIYLNRRVAAAENVSADLFVSIHVDSYSDDESVNGLTVHYESGAAKGEILAEKIHSVLETSDVTKIRKLMESDLYVLRNTSMPATLIEVGFLTNQTDRENLQSETFLNALCGGIYEGIIEYISENEKN